MNARTGRSMTMGAKIVIAGACAIAFFGLLFFAKSLGWLDRNMSTSVEGPAPKTDLPSYTPVARSKTDTALAASVPLPGTELGCANLPVVKVQHWAWNAHMGAMLAVGGQQSTKGSLMCQNGVNLLWERQDWPNLMQEAMIAFATAWSKGEKHPTQGTHFVTIMGDASAQFFGALNPKLRKICGKECEAKVVGSFGRSLGEDTCMGPTEWRDDVQKMRGAYIAGVCKDGDWNICVKKGRDNEIATNPNANVYDPDKLNFLCTDGYMEAAEAYNTNTCSELVNVQSKKKEKICVNGVATWTPGDVKVAQGRGGLVSVADTSIYSGQMPNIVIGFNPWMKENPAVVKGMLRAAFQGAQAVWSSDVAFTRASEISNDVYQEKGTGPAYWKKYFKRVTERDVTGLSVELGGSGIHDLAENIALFGLDPQFKNAFEGTYTTFGDIVKHYYPKDLPTYPPVNEVVDMSYLRALMAENTTPIAAKVEAPSYEEVAKSETKKEVGRRAYNVTFDTGFATISPSSAAVLAELTNNLVIAQNTVVEIHGHTDNTGDPGKNKQLSEDRAFAVRKALQDRGSANFRTERFRVFAHGQDNPVESNGTTGGRAANRRVEIVLLSK